MRGRRRESLLTFFRRALNEKFPFFRCAFLVFSVNYSRLAFAIWTSWSVWQTSEISLRKSLLCVEPQPYEERSEAISRFHVKIFFSIKPSRVRDMLVQQWQFLCLISEKLCMSPQSLCVSISQRVSVEIMKLYWIDFIWKNVSTVHQHRIVFSWVRDRIKVLKIDFFCAVHNQRTS